MIPIASTAKGTYGQDPYSLTAQSTVLPALFELPQLSNGKLDEHQRTMLEVQLVRDRNRIADTLDRRRRCRRGLPRAGRRDAKTGKVVARSGARMRF